MTKVERIQPEGVPTPYASYSTTTRVGDTVYTAGLVSHDIDGNLVGKGSAREQAATTCGNLQRICEHFGVTLENVISCTQYIVNREDYREVDAGFVEVFGDVRPSRATVLVDLTDPDMLYELVAVIQL